MNNKPNGNGPNQTYQRAYICFGITNFRNP